MITGLNHITLAVSDLERSLHFYTQVLGLTGHAKWNNGAYLSAGKLWLCLSCDEPCAKTDYTHIAFDVAQADFDACCARLEALEVRQWKLNKSEGHSIYILDPDGHKLEIHAGGLQSRLASLVENPYSGLVWL
ncbi:fosfomycin resistance glutathione transferase [Halomonas aquamarina]|uniref:Fosfomycin resistance glutathione transferase n=1 Tax=Vreelandella aquamarina TaxID=77097 RepID=A0ACC5VW45_9GAMM|nr:fosfomycin resistance glutathione transferase [Halomonas aquamarina]MBZ5488363.1 fosfomycin resistance glutathione transferase [Halomonas aquamarina]